MGVVRHEVVLSNGDVVELEENDIDELGYDGTFLYFSYKSKNRPCLQAIVPLCHEPDEDKSTIGYAFHGDHDKPMRYYAVEEK